MTRSEVRVPHRPPLCGVFCFACAIMNTLMVNPDRRSESRRRGGVVQVILAWLTVPFLGLTTLFITSFITGLIVFNTVETTESMRFLAIDGVLGVVFLALMILGFYRLKQIRYIFHLLIGLWIGLGLYVLMFLVGSVMYVISISLDNNSMSNNTAVVCTDPIDQYSRYGSAIVPVATNLGSGSGFLIDKDGTILTAHHVIKGANDIYANYADGRQTLRVIDTAPAYDLALLKINDIDDATPMPISEDYSDGDSVVAYGYPGNALDGGPPSITAGIISRVLAIEDLRLTDVNFPNNLEIIQTDAAINPGNSGGALIGACGAIGVVVAMSDSAQLGDYIGVASEQGIGYAVSIKTAKKVLDI